MQHRFAYVGNDLQDLFGIDATTIATATNMSDAFFASGDAARTLADLARTPDGILVSAETVHDFQLQPGDLIRIRLQSARDHAYHAVPFHYIGIVREFPTAPSDSFLVANSSYVARRTSSPAYQTLLVRTTTSPPAVARAIRRLVGPSGATVKDIVAQRRITLSGLTAIDLEGLTRVELSFAVALAAAGSGLVLWLGLSERLRTFAIAAALGARRRQLAAFVWSEAAFVTTGGIVLGAATGWAISLVIVKILTGVFDPPPEHLSVPWGYIVGVVTASLAAAVAAAIATLRTTSQRALGAIKDL
jgi:putative ABC transport system permease protein